MAHDLTHCQFDQDKQTAPRAALRFRVPVEFAKKQTAESGETPITMLARSSEPIEHWYWGKIAHDFSGMQLRKEHLPLDYCHDPSQIVGVGTEFTTDAAGLHVSGKLVSAFAGDRVDEITKLAAAGVPYEASIDFYGPMKLERVRENEVAQVNGQQFEGPGIIVRQWMLNAVAVCPLGADSNTRSQFAAGEAADVEITLHDPEATAMGATTPKTEAKTTDTPAVDPQLAQPQTPPAAVPDPVDPVKQFAAKLAQFNAEFGAVNGSKWAAEGKTYEEAVKLHVAELNAQLAAKDTENGELKTKLAAVDKGETSAVSFSEEGGAGSDGKSKNAKPGSNRAKFTAGTKLPAGWNGKK
jgi:hypothetical protein